MNRQSVPRFGTFNIEGPGLGVDLGKIDIDTRQVLDGLECVVERILSPQLQGRARLDAHDGLSATEGVGELITGRGELNELHRVMLATPRASG